METSDMIKALRDLREQLGEPVTNMQLIRKLVNKEIGKQERPELQMLIPEQHRSIMHDNLGKFQGFLESQDGSDAFELLLASFHDYVNALEAVEKTIAPPVVEVAAEPI